MPTLEGYSFAVPWRTVDKECVIENEKSCRGQVNDAALGKQKSKSEKVKKSTALKSYTKY